jgi:catechol 2,3-dioxygenase-like lactoylglutathione lyase family enzyme
MSANQLPTVRPEGRIESLDHVAVKVTDMDDALEGLVRLGFLLHERQVHEAVGIEVAFLSLGPVEVELLRSIHEASPIHDAPPGLHHMAVRCLDLEGAIARLGEAAQPDGPPRTGARGHPVRFVRLRGSGMLLELVEGR